MDHTKVGDQKRIVSQSLQCGTYLVTTITKGKLSDGSSDGGWSKMDSTEPEYSTWNLLLI